MTNTWLSSIDDQELFSICPELAQIDRKELDQPDAAIDLVREVKATQFYFPPLPQAMYPTPDIDEFNELRRSNMRKTKDYDLEDVKKLDEAKNKYWQAVKNEIRLLICTKDKKYSELRKQLHDAAKHTKAPIVAMISATLAGSMGVAVGIISGLVAVAIFAIVQIGVNVYCATIS